MIEDSGIDVSVGLTPSNRFGYYAAILTAVITVVTFGFALIAIPISGANCPADCVNYPYLDTVSQFPRDFLWMPFAVLLVLAYVTVMVSIHSYAPGSKKIFSQAGLSFALIAGAILIADYYLQFSIIPVSLMHNETQGLPLLIQYNPHGVFLALEELGYLIMSLSFVLVAPVFAGKNRLESAIQWVFIGAFLLVIIFLAWITIVYGLGREDRFEVAALSTDWLALIINGTLLSIVFRRRMSLAPS